MGDETIEAIADKGYLQGRGSWRRRYAPSRPTAGEGRFDGADFVYIADEDAYICPAGERLTYRFTNDEAGRRCCTHTGRMLVRSCAIKRQVHHRQRASRPALGARGHPRARTEAARRRPEQDPVRSKTVEHPFGTIKAWMGATHFKMKTLKHVATEMALHVLAYNLKRVIAILGVPKLLSAIRS